MRARARNLGLIAFSFAAGCVQASYNLAAERQDYSFTSVQREVSIGRKVAHKVEEEIPPVQDQPLQERVDSIGQRLVAVCDRKELPYTFRVIQDDTLNAFSLPGGYVFLYKGLVDKTANDDELAAVIGHEIGHIAARHAIHRYESQMGAQILQLAAVATRQGPAAAGVGIAAQATQLAYARDEELEADRLAVKYLKAAGFDATAVLSFLRKMEEIHKDESHYMPRGVVRPNYAFTHPGIPERILAAKEALYGVADYIDYLNTPP